MVGQQHQRAPDEIGAGGVEAPGGGEAGVSRALAGLAGRRIDHGFQQVGGLHGKSQRRAASRRWFSAGAGGQDQEQARPGAVGGGWFWAPRGFQRRAMTATQQPADVLQRQATLGQFGGVAAAIPEPSACHRRDRRRQHRLAPGDGFGGDVGGPASARLLLGQGGDIRGAIEAAARVLRMGGGLDPAPADIGVEGLRPDPQPFQHLIRVQPIRHID